MNTQKAPGTGWENDGKPRSNEKLEAGDIGSSSSLEPEIRETVRPLGDSRRGTNDPTQRRGSRIEILQSGSPGEIAAFDIEKRPSQLEVKSRESSQSRAQPRRLSVYSKQFSSNKDNSPGPNELLEVQLTTLKTDIEESTIKLKQVNDNIQNRQKLLAELRDTGKDAPENSMDRLYFRMSQLEEEVLLRDRQIESHLKKIST